jgi:hypothetical protein
MRKNGQTRFIFKARNSLNSLNMQRRRRRRRRRRGIIFYCYQFLLASPTTLFFRM